MGQGFTGREPHARTSVHAIAIELCGFFVVTQSDRITDRIVQWPVNAELTVKHR